MSQWKNNDAAGNSVLWAAGMLNTTPNTGNQTNLFGNVTSGSFVSGQKVGQFGVDATEMAVTAGPILGAEVTSAGSGYFANATVTVAGGGGANGVANAQANSLGRITAVNISTAGTGYETGPTLTVAAPAAQTFNANTALYNAQTFNSNTALYNAATFNANTAVDNTTDFIAIASNPFVDTDVVIYTVAANNTAVSGLTNATSYYVVSANSTGVKLALTSGGANINITASATSETGHTLTRNGFLNIGSNPFVNTDVVVYTVAAGNTAVTGLANATSYYVRDANTSGIRLAATLTGNAIALVPAVSETGHTLTRNGFLNIGSNVFQNTDVVTYLTATGNTAISGLTNAASYYVRDANTSGLRLATTLTGAAIALVPAVSETGHSLTGQTATAVATVAGAKNAGITHAGWNLRRVGTGGRAGRVTNECLVAMGSMTADAEDTILPDS